MAPLKRKKVKYLSERTLVLCSIKQQVFQYIVLGAESVVTEIFFSEKFTILF